MKYNAGEKKITAKTHHITPKQTKTQTKAVGKFKFALQKFATLVKFVLDWFTSPNKGWNPKVFKFENY